MGYRIAVGVECLGRARGGICRVGLDLFENLALLDPDKDYLLVSHRPLSGVEGKVAHGSLFHPRLPDSAAVFLFTQFRLPSIIKRLGADLYLHTGSPPIFPLTPSWRSIRKVLYLHDVINIKSPRFFGPLTFINAYPSKLFSVRAFDHVLTNSGYTKDDAVRHLGADPDKMTVVHPGLSKTFENAVRSGAGPRGPSRVREPFILFVGTLEPRKNLQGLLRAFSLSGLSHTHRLVVAGAKGWKTGPISRAVRALDARGSVVFAGHVENDELAGLYLRAELLCYPSFDEGFGLPVLEAMAAGTPVVASLIPSVIEVGGDAPLYIDPKDPRNIARGLVKVVKDRDLRERMATLGRARARIFSWKESALKVIAVLDALLEGRRP